MGVRLAVLLAILVTTAPAPGQESSTDSGDLARLQGTWEAKAGPAKQQTLRMTIKGIDLTLRYSVPGRAQPITLQGRIKLDETSRPRAMDWLDMKTGAQELPPVFSIYEFKGDTLRVRGSGAKVRPTEFQDDDDVPRHRSLVFERVKDDAPKESSPD